MNIPCCALCGFCVGHVILVRFSLVMVTTEGYEVYRYIVPPKAGDDDKFICTRCVRDIKRAPFSAIEASVPVVDPRPPVTDMEPPF